MTVSAEGLVDAAKKSVRAVSVEEAQKLVGASRGVFVDVRETEERSQVAIAGSIHASRGNLEFLIDPSHSAFLPAFTTAHTLIFVCGSGARAVLSAKLAQEFGYDACYLTGGMRAWTESNSDH